MVIDVGLFKQQTSMITGIPPCDDVYTFYYDETANCRKFSLTDKGFNSESAVENNFILAGVLHTGGEYQVNFDALYAQLGYSEGQKELKFKHLYHNSKNFLDFIGSKRATAYITWLFESGLYVHYSTLNNLYYALVDIVDSLYDLYPYIICNPEWCTGVKSALYDFVVKYRDGFTDILIKYGYPNIQECTSFCQELCDFIRQNNDEDENYPGFFMELLRQMLKQAGKRNQLVFVQDNEPNKLIDEYYLFYLERCELFSKSHHIFDEEKTVQARIKDIIFEENGEQFTNFEFCNSQDNRFIQISDLWCGTLGKLFRYLDEIDENSIMTIKRSLSDDQQENLRMIFELIHKSDMKCPHFLKNSNASSSINSRMKKLMTLI